MHSLFAAHRAGGVFSRIKRVDFWILLGIFFVFYFYKLANYGQMIDDEKAALRAVPTIWLTQGRWGAYLFELLVLPNPPIPFLPTFLFGIFMCAGYLIVMAAHDVDRLELVHYVTFPLFVAFPVWIFLSAFSSNVAASGLAMVFSALALKHCKKLIEQDGLRNVKKVATHAMRAAIFCAAAIGIYQTFIFVVAVLALGLVLASAQRNHWTISRIAMQLLQVLAVMLLGLLFYKIIDLVFMRALHVERSGYVEQFSNVDQLLAKPREMFFSTWASLKAIYGGSAQKYGVEVIGFPLLMLSGALGVVFGRSFRGWQKVWASIIVACIACIPFMMELISGGMPLRTFIAVPSVFWLFSMFGMTAGVRWLEGLAGIALVLSLYGVMHSTNTLQATQAYVKSHDQMLAADIYRRIAEVSPDFDRTKIYMVDVFGAKEFESLYPRIPSSTLGYSFFEWDDGNPEGRMLAHMRALGYTNLRVIPFEQRKENFKKFEEMPMWPAMGSVKNVNGVILIKLGRYRGYPFNF